MARPIKQGLDYFPFDTDIFTDDKIRFIDASFGKTGLTVIIMLFCRIYRNGFYALWDEDTIVSFSKYDANIPHKKCVKIIDEALKRDIFDHNIFEKYGILTSRGIQKRYFEASRKRKLLQVDFRYLLVNPNEYSISDVVNPELTHINYEKTPQRKGKEIITNESEKIDCTLSQFYKNQIILIDGNDTNVAKVYSKLVAFILGENELNRSLNNLSQFHEQLAFTQFEYLWMNKCGTLPMYQDALMKIEGNPDYRKGTSLYTRLSSWFDNEKQPENLRPAKKTGKIYPKG